MVAFNFRPEFVEPIRANRKLQTIRGRQRCAPGNPMHLYTGQRTAACQLIALRPCALTDYVHIAPDGLTLGNVRKHPRNIDAFAQLDGFDTFEAMQAWFAARYPDSAGHFIGHVHRWEPAAIALSVQPGDLA